MTTINTEATALLRDAVSYRRAAKAAFGIYSNTISCVPSLKSDDLIHGRKLERISNGEWFEPQSSATVVVGRLTHGTNWAVHVGLVDSETISITYMGTNRVTDVVPDLLCGMEAMDSSDGQGKIRVHQGFKHSYNSSRGAVVAQIKTLSAGKLVSHLQFFGHSKGGAEATLAAYDLSSRSSGLGLPADFKVSLVTFGQPHVGNKAFVEDFRSRLPEKRRGQFKRFANQFDPVPQLLEGWNLAHPEDEDRYEHHCDEFVLDSYWLLDRDYIASAFKKMEGNISTMSDLLTSVPAALVLGSSISISGLASCKAVADLVTRHHSALQYIYCLELVLQVRKRTTVDQAGSRMQWTWTQLRTRAAE